jgi:anti-sigma regulatory factor (Ser/Thr protein kinase)
VRRFVTAVLSGESGATVLVDLVDLVEIVVSELATNAVQHSRSGQPGACFTVTVGFDAGMLRLRVADEGGTSEPHPLEPDEGGETGRGLSLVAALAQGWGVDGDAGARVVWADFAVVPDLGRAL